MRDGGQRDYDEFVRARSPALLRTAMLLVGDREHGEDLLQLALWRTHRHWRQALEHPDAYVRKVLVNLAHDRRRWAHRRVREAPLTDARHPVAPDRFVALVERDALVAGLLALPPRQRATLVLRFWDDLSVEETAAVMNCSPGTVKSATSKGLAALRQVLAGQAAIDERTRTRP